MVEKNASLKTPLRAKEKIEKDLKGRIVKFENIMQAKFSVLDRVQAEIEPKLRKCETSIKTFDSALESIRVLISMLTAIIA